jgi:hypothetical protein
MTHATWYRKSMVRNGCGRGTAMDEAAPAEVVVLRARRDTARALRPAVLIALMAIGRTATASEATSPGEGTDVRAEFQSEASIEHRPFAFVVDPSTPGRGTINLACTLGMGSGISADRPIPVVLQSAGLSNQLSLGYGLTNWLEPLAELTMVTSNGSTFASAMLGMKFQLTPPDSQWRAAVMTGALREGATGAYGMWVRAAGSWGTGPLLIEVNGYAESVSATGRDAIDYAVMGGASWRFLEWLRTGAEYVGQDLEEMGGGGAEGGARQAVGPSVAIDLDRGRYQIVAATLFGLGAQSPTALVRVGLLGTY